MDGISTGFGAWNPIAWSLLFAGAAAIAWGVRRFGRRDCARGTGQTKAFLSGNEAPAPEALHARGDHLYWGMIDGLAAYYRRIRAVHTGILSDYVGWFVGVLGVVLLVLMLVR